MRSMNEEIVRGYEESQEKARHRTMRYIDFIGGFSLGMAMLMVIVFLITTVGQKCIVPPGHVCV